MALYEEAVEHFGEKAQLLQTVEEMAELAKALLKYIRYKDFGHGDLGDILECINEERADVSIMLNQLQVIFGDNSEDECMKLKHLREFLDEDGRAESDVFTIPARRCKRCGGLLTSKQGLRDGYGPCCLQKMRQEEASGRWLRTNTAV